MIQIVSNTGAPVVNLGDWVSTSGNAGYAALVQQYTGEMIRGETINDPAFNAMVDAFLAATNQSLQITI